MPRRLIPWRRGSGAETGMTLIELAVAILVLSIGSLAALRAADQSRQAVGGELPRQLARIAARNRAEELIALGRESVDLPPTVIQGGLSFALSTEAEPTAGGLLRVLVTARVQSGEGAALYVYLPGVTLE